MTDDPELMRGSGNVFTDFGDPNAEAKKLKATIAAESSPRSTRVA